MKISQSQSAEIVKTSRADAQSCFERIVEQSLLCFVGMPSSGKSALGCSISRSLGWGFIDLDVEIEQSEGSSLNEVLQRRGDREFIEMESSYLRKTHYPPRTVIAPGGSIIYHPEARDFLRLNCFVIFLNVSLATLEGRLAENPKAIVMGGKDLAELFAERAPIYRDLSHFEIRTNGASLESLMNAAMACIPASWKPNARIASSPPNIDLISVARLPPPR